MKFPALILTGSLVANAALLAAFAIKPSLAPAPLRAVLGERPLADGNNAPLSSERHPRKSAVGKGRSQDVWSQLTTSDMPSLIARLQASSFPPAQIRAIVLELVNARYNARMRALSEPDLTKPYWQSDFGAGMNATQREEYALVSRERSRILRELFDDPALRDESGVSTSQQRRYGDLSQARIDQVQRIEEDYAELTQQARSASINSVTLPEDREKIAYLEKEKRADLAALLSPQELEEYDMRTSTVALRLRGPLDFLGASEDEFRAIYRVHAAHDGRVTTPPSSGMTLITAEMSEQRKIAVREINDEIRATLGDQRYAEYARSMNRDFQQLHRLAQQANLEPAAAVQAFDLRDHVSRESHRIVADAALSNDAKRAALQALGQSTRGQLLATLGPSVGASYMRTAESWLSNVERGAAVTFTDPGGSITFAPTYTRVPPPPRPVPPAPR